MSQQSYTPVPQQDFVALPPQAGEMQSAPSLQQPQYRPQPATGHSQFMPVMPSPATMGAVASAASSASALLPQRYTVDGLRQWKNERFKDVRPWTDLLDKNRIRKPTSWSVAQERINANWSYYQSNYILIFLVICIFCLISTPFLLFVIIFLVGAQSFISNVPSDRIQIGGNSYEKSKLKLYLNIGAIPLLYFASAWSALLWVATVSGVVIGGHGAILEPPVERAFAEPV